MKCKSCGLDVREKISVDDLNKTLKEAGNYEFHIGDLTHSEAHRLDLMLSNMDYYSDYYNDSDNGGRVCDSDDHFILVAKKYEN